MTDELQSFRHHCKLYYEKSLSISENGDSNEQKNGQYMEESKIVLDTFEHHIRYAHSNALLLPSTHDIIMNSSPTSNTASPANVQDELFLEQREFLLSARIRKHSNILKECGLYIEYNDDPSKIIYLPQHSLTEYAKVKDKERHSAHESKMKERRNMFCHYLQETIQNEKMNLSSRFIGEYDVTMHSYLSHARSCMRNFVNNYQSNLGSHSLLAGMKKLIEKQIEMKEVICLWKFNSTVISESSLFLISNGESGQSPYMIDSVNVLCSFLVYCGERRDIESNDATTEKEIDDVCVTFHIHPFISNSFLRQMLYELPSNLDARPTGKFFSYDQMSIKDEEEKSKIQLRTNHIGQLDESYLMHFLHWSNAFCEIS